MRVLAPDEVHIWRFALNQPVDASILAVDERARADRLKIPLVRARFIAGRVRLRQLLSQYTNTSPGSLTFSYNTAGKPDLQGSPLHFNLTHSDDLALLAVAHQPVGIDLEQFRPLAGFGYLVNTALNQAERTAFNQLPEDRKNFTFFRLWTSKEAVMKALGGGFKLAQQINFDLTDAEHPQLISLPEDTPSAWLLAQIPVSPTHTATLAVRQSPARLTFLNGDLNQGDVP